MSESKMPLVFIGHGSPMHAIADNSFTQMLSGLGRQLPRPKAILMISAHWMTSGTWVTGMEKPKTIHDFYGFPQELFDVQYPAAGSPSIAENVKSVVTLSAVNNDLDQWGLDHGTWAVLRHMYPKADIPVLQLSLDMKKPPEYHYEIGQQLSKLREQGVLIIGSGNLVHNLRKISWEPNAAPVAWAVEFDEWTKQKLESRDFKSLIADYNKTLAGQLSVPSMDHYFPVNYILGASDSKDELEFKFDEIQNSSIGMRTFVFSPTE